MSLDGELFEIQIAVLPDCFGIIPKLHHLLGDAWAYVLISTQFNMLLSDQIPETHSFAEYVELDKTYRTSKKYIRDLEFFKRNIAAFDEPVYLCE